MSLDPVASVRDGEDVLFTVLVPFLTGDSLEQTLEATRRATAALGVSDAPMRSARHTRADYGVVRTALHYLLTLHYPLTLYFPSSLTDAPARGERRVPEAAP